MKAEEFVNSVLGIKPSVEELKALGYSELLVNHVLKGFNVRKLVDGDQPNEILKLILNYDVSSFSIHDISFDLDFMEDSEYVYFASDVNDTLAISKLNNSVVAYDYPTERIMFQCAETDEKFLDALFEILKHSKERMLRKFKNDTELDKKAYEVAYIAALKAGGEKYEDYYLYILGAGQ